jgi:sulfur relay (sulfurtransferase) DsrF/TusC family protein
MKTQVQLKQDLLHFYNEGYYGEQVNGYIDDNESSFKALKEKSPESNLLRKIYELSNSIYDINEMDVLLKSLSEFGLNKKPEL